MNEELIWRLWNGEILVSIINGKQANYLDNLLVEFGFPIPVFFLTKKMRTTGIDYIIILFSRKITLHKFSLCLLCH